MNRTTTPLYWIECLSQKEPYKFTRTCGYNRYDDTHYYTYIVWRQVDGLQICVLRYEPYEYKDHEILTMNDVPIQKETNGFNVCKSIISVMDKAIETQSHKFDKFIYEHMHEYKLKTYEDMCYDVHINGIHTYRVIYGFEQQTDEFQRHFNLVHPNLHALPLNIPITSLQFKNLINRSFDNRTL